MQDVKRDVCEIIILGVDGGINLWVGGGHFWPTSLSKALFFALFDHLEWTESPFLQNFVPKSTFWAFWHFWPKPQKLDFCDNFGQKCPPDLSFFCDLLSGPKLSEEGVMPSCAAELPLALSLDINITKNGIKNKREFSKGSTESTKPDPVRRAARVSVSPLSSTWSSFTVERRRLAQSPTVGPSFGSPCLKT